jgi:hypothetical protein
LFYTSLSHRKSTQLSEQTNPNTETYLKRYWPEEDILFYLHFEGNKAVRQIEISPTGLVKLSADHPNQEESMLYDQDLEDLDDFEVISAQDFDDIWK